MTFKCRQCWKITNELTARCDSCGLPNTLDEIDDDGHAVPSGQILIPSNASDIIDVSATIVEDANANDGRERSVPSTQVEEPDISRCTTGIEQLDLTLSGGPAFETTIMIHGDPGVGKSTLLAQVLSHMAEELDMTVLYATAEESKKMIVEKLVRTAKLHANLRILSTSNFDDVLADLEENEPDVVVIDSLQEFAGPGAKGSRNQVIHIASEAYAKSKDLGIIVFIICQENKDNEAAGPKTVEHKIDTMLEFRWVDKKAQTLELHCSKNRVGNTAHVGEFRKLANGTIVSVTPEKKVA